MTFTISGLKCFDGMIIKTEKEEIQIFVGAEGQAIIKVKKIERRR